MAEKTDESCVQQAYEEELVQHVKDYIANLIDQTPQSEDKFLAGLKVIRCPCQGNRNGEPFGISRRRQAGA